MSGNVGRQIQVINHLINIKHLLPLTHYPADQLLFFHSHHACPTLNQLNVEGNRQGALGSALGFARS